MSKTRVAEYVKGELIAKNPFKGIKTQLVIRTDRMQFVTLEETQQLIDAAPDADWRCIIALARYGGLRTPSETLALRWTDINWEKGEWSYPRFVGARKRAYHDP